VKAHLRFDSLQNKGRELRATEGRKGDGMGIGRRLAATAGISMAILLLSGSAAFAHDCFNPRKDAHAPTAGVHYVITSFAPFTIEQVGNGKGVGGFLALAPGATGAPITVYTHSLGNSGHDEVGGPGSRKANHACDGKGIDYLDPPCPTP
jgi:hypothetical protein